MYNNEYVQNILEYYLKLLKKQHSMCTSSNEFAICAFSFIIVNLLLKAIRFQKIILTLYILIFCV